MTDHLGASLLNGLVDGELSSEQVMSVQRHLDFCPACTSEALTQTLLKNAVSRSGQHLKVPPEFEQRMNDIIFSKAKQSGKRTFENGQRVRSRTSRLIAYSGWAAAALLLIALAGSILLLRAAGRSETIVADNVALVKEVSDFHVAMLAASQQLQVVSSDRHTVKPWFAGKIPFSFNLPEHLPEDTKLEGANLVFLHGAPVAQLIYSIGRHRASLFVRETKAGDASTRTLAEFSGFQVAVLDTAELNVIVVTDADRPHLTALVSAFGQAQLQSSTSQELGP